MKLTRKIRTYWFPALFAVIAIEMLAILLFTEQSAIAMVVFGVAALGSAYVSAKEWLNLR